MFKGDWRLYAAFGIALLGLWNQPAQSQNGDNARAAVNHAEASQNAPPVDLSPLQNQIMSVASDVKSLEADNASKASTEHGQQTYENVISGLNLAIAFVVMLITGGGTWVIWQTLKHTADSTKAAVDGIENAKRADRAWMIALDPILEPSGVNDLEQTLRAQLVWKNCGNSPAAAVQFKIGYRMVQGPDFSTPTFDSAKFLVVYRADVGQGEKSTTPELALVHDEVLRITGSKAAFFLYGRVDYFDVFEPNQPRFSEVCYWVRHQRGMPYAVSFVPMPAGEQNRVT